LLKRPEMGDEDEDTKIYKYEGEREVGEVVQITETHPDKPDISQTQEVTLLGQRSGKGLATFPNGDVYDGSYGKGVRSGPGKYTYAPPPLGEEEEAPEEPPPPVAVYEGAWKMGHKTGVGTMTYADGSKYQGSWVKGKRQGIGTFYYPNGDIYSGDWEAGKKHGHGTYIFKATQTRLKGTWEKGVAVSGEFSDDFGNVYKGSFGGDGSTMAYAAGGTFTLASGAVAPYVAAA